MFAQMKWENVQMKQIICVAHLRRQSSCHEIRTVRICRLLCKFTDEFQCALTRVADWLWCRLRIRKRFHLLDWVNVLRAICTQSAYAADVYGYMLCVFVYYRYSGKRDSDAGCHTDYIHNKSRENTRTLYQIHCYNSIVNSVICVRPCTATKMYATICMCVAPYSTEFTIYIDPSTLHIHTAYTSHYS